MPRAAKQKWYAVKNGREGTKIYETWEEAEPNITGCRGVKQKSFSGRVQAEEWLRSIPENTIKTKPLQVLPFVQTNIFSSLTGDGPSHNPMGISDEQDKSGPDSSTVDLESLPSGVRVNPYILESETIQLSPEQQQVLDMVKTRQSVFFTGSAGTGKSVLLRQIIQWCKNSSITHAVTASTGIAAVNIGGCTLHSWAGIGLGKEPAEYLVGKILGQAKRQKKKQRESEDSTDVNNEPLRSRVLDRWRSCRVLIIDEISMIDGKLFDKLDYIGRTLRNSSLPFGGIQLVLSGDFYQLPPVPDSDNSVPIPATFTFDALSWDSCVGRPVSLRKVFRQKDQDFVDMLNAMRFGRLTADTIRRFKELDRPVKYDDGLSPTELFATRREVDAANSNRLDKLTSEKFTFKSSDTPGWDAEGNRISQKHMYRLLDRLVAPEDLVLKVGAQVMLIKNIIQGVLVNGSLGRVTEFCTKEEALRKGVTIGIVEADSQRRVWKGEEIARLKNPPDNEAWIRAMKDRVPPEKYPVVEFITTDSGPMSMLCVPSSFEVINAEGEIEAKREQVPLILAWALSIHKSQGQTLQRVKVSLERIFESGQAYVALSRATSMDSLEVSGFDPGKVKVHPRVKEWAENNIPHITLSSVAASEEDDSKYWSGV